MWKALAVWILGFGCQPALASTAAENMLLLDRSYRDFHQGCTKIMQRIKAIEAEARSAIGIEAGDPQRMGIFLKPAWGSVSPQLQKIGDACISGTKDLKKNISLVKQKYGEVDAFAADAAVSAMKLDKADAVSSQELNAKINAGVSNRFDTLDSAYGQLILSVGEEKEGGDSGMIGHFKEMQKAGMTAAKGWRSKMASLRPGSPAIGKASDVATYLENLRPLLDESAIEPLKEAGALAGSQRGEILSVRAAAKSQAERSGKNAEGTGRIKLKD